MLFIFTRHRNFTKKWLAIVLICSYFTAGCFPIPIPSMETQTPSLDPSPTQLKETQTPDLVTTSTQLADTNTPDLNPMQTQATETVTIPSTEPTAELSNEEVGKWGQYKIVIDNSTWNGNPFDLEFEGIFVHQTSGRQVRQIGFFAGNNTWKIFFMPDEVGEWTYMTKSPDPDLDGKSGSFTCIPSDLPGRLIGQENFWFLEDKGKYVAPIILPVREWFKRTDTQDGVDEFIHWSKDTVGAMIIGTTLVYFGHAQDEVPYIKEQEGILFNISMWDRLNSHYDMVRDNGMGFYIMFYSDDQESPDNYNITGMSLEEIRLFRYAIARFSAYPIVIWDTGIDIGEYRSNEWIDWFADWMNANDPWKHPVSSRTGGGSGGKFPLNATYLSNGSSTLPSHDDVLFDWRGLDVPMAYTDRWREDYGRGNFDRNKIRQASWEIGLVGGTAIYVGGDENNGYLSSTYASDFEAAPDLGIRSRFFESNIRDLRRLIPHDELINSGNGVILSADPGMEYVIYDNDGGSFEINLSHLRSPLRVEWLNPRTGQVIPAGLVTVTESRMFLSPFSGDAVLHIGGTSSSSSEFGEAVRMFGVNWFNPQTGDYFCKPAIVGSGIVYFESPFEGDDFLHLYRKNTLSFPDRFFETSFLLPFSNNPVFQPACNS